MRTNTWLSLLTCVVALQTAGAAHAQRSGDPLRPIVSCIESGPLRAQKIDRLPETSRTRKVDMPNGPLRVSIADGYRALLTNEQGQLLVNLKVEQSAKAAAQTDRQTLIEQMNAYAKHAPKDAPPMVDETTASVRTLGVNQPTLGKHGIVGMYTLLVEPTDVVTTLYFVNPTSAANPEPSYTDYEAQRDKVLRHVQSCLNAKI